MKIHFVDFRVSVFYRRCMLLLYIFFSFGVLNARDGSGKDIFLILDKRFSPLFGVSFIEETRWNSNYSKMDWSINIFEADFYVHPCLKLASAYLFMKQTSGVNRNTFHSLSLEATGKKTLGFIDLSLRERCQFIFIDKSRKDAYLLRNRLRLGFNTKLFFSPYVYGEPFCDLRDNFNVMKWRLSAGLVFKLNKQNAIDFYYRHHIMNCPDSFNYDHNLGVIYIHHF